MTTQQANRMFRARFRALVVKNEQARESHQRVIAIAIDQNLVGRGEKLDEALDSLVKALMQSWTLEWAELVPAYVPDPDPELGRVFEDKSATHTPEEDLVLRRLNLELLFVLQEEASTSPITPQVTYEECPV